MQKTYFSTEPEKILYLPQSDGTAEAYLRKNTRQTEEGWEADEVQIRTRLTEEEILAQFDSYFVERIETTIGDLVEAIDILTGIVLEG